MAPRHEINRRELLRRSALVAGGAAALSARPTGGTAASAAAQEQVTLSFWSSLMGSKEEARTRLIDAFQAAYPQITVEHTGIDDVTENNQKVLAAIASGSAPDVVSNHFYYAVNYADAEQLEPLDALMQEAGLAPEEIEPNLLKTGVWEGQTYSLPLYGTSRALMYNRALVAEAGLDPEQPPRTWDELRAWATQLTRRGDGGRLEVAGFLATPTTAEGVRDLYTVLLSGAGGALVSEDCTQPLFNSPEGVRALQFWVDLIQQDKVSDVGFGEGQTGAQAPFNVGSAAMMLGGNFSAYLARQAGVDFGISLFPTPDGGVAAFADPFVIFIPKSAKNKAAAREFVRFAMSAEQQAEFAVNSNNLPAVIAAQDDPRIVGNADLTPFVEALSVAEPPPITPVYAEMWDGLGGALEQAIYGNVSPEDALADAESRLTPLLAERGAC